MRRIVLVLLALFGASCALETHVQPADAERASELNAQLGLGYMKQNRYDLAMAKLEKAIKFNSNNAQAHHFKAELHRRLKEYDIAKSHYITALDLTPKDSLLNNNYGVFLCELKDYKAAQELFTKVINDPRYDNKGQAYENIGICSLAQGNLQNAEEAFRNALSMNPKLPQSLLNLAQISYDKRDGRAAYNYFTRFLSLSDHTPGSLWLGILLEQERGNNNAVNSYTTLLKGKYPDSKEAELLRKQETTREQ